MILQNEDAIKKLCQTVQRHVVSSGVLDGQEENDELLTKVNEILANEIKALLTGEEYQEERDCILMNSVPTSVIVTSVTLSCVTKIKEIL